MYDLVPIEIAASGMHVQRARMGTIASNLANAQSTRSAEDGGPYKRRVLKVEAATMPAFEDLLGQMREAKEKGEVVMMESLEESRYLAENHLRGARIKEVVMDPSTRRVYDPAHPDCDAEGYVTYPDISVVAEMTDMIMASRNYEANLAVVKNTRDMHMQLLELLKG